LIFSGKLRNYQVGVADEILKAGDNGIIKLGTGFGKTLIACEIIRKLNKTALIIVPRVSLLTQFRETLEEFYGYEAGIIQGETWDIKDITVASIATLRQRSCEEIRSKFSCVIADEAHTFISSGGIKTIESLSDGQGEAIKFTFGEILIDKKLPQEKPTVHVVKSNVPIEGLDYMEMVTDMVENYDRTKLIWKLIDNEMIENRKILVLVKRVKHFENLMIWYEQYYSRIYKIHTISSKTPQKERDVLLTKLRNNEEDFDIIMGTYSMLSTGVDIPALDTLILAGDIKSDVLAEQCIGRILRLFVGKSSPKVIDIDDNLNGLFHRQHLERKKFYKSNEWEII